MRYLIFIALLPLVLLAETPKSLLRKGNRAFMEGKNVEAVKDYDSALQQLPDNPYLMYNKGVAYLADANYEQAAQQFLEAQKKSLAAKKHDVEFEARCLASAGDAQYSQAKAMSESKEQNQQQLEAALKLCQDATANYQNSLKVKPGNKDVQEAAKQANLLNKKLLGMKYLLPPPPPQQQQQKQQQDKDKDDKKDQKQQQQQQEQQQQQDKQDKQEQQQEQKQQEQQQQQQEQQQQQQQQQQEKQEEKEAEAEAKEILDQEKQDKKERQKILMKQMKVKAVEQDW